MKKLRDLPCFPNITEKKGPFEFEEWKVNRLCVIKIEVEKMTGKESGF